MYCVAEIDPLIETFVQKIMFGPKPPEILDENSQKILNAAKLKFFDEVVPKMASALGDHPYFGGDEVITEKKKNRKM